ncbi:MAG TPA: hypothetical protein VJU86_12585 [Pyrinomonadaceae bacterium]|nr:hypothetical protein [Pyrinomonadaceae bacterium]
MAVTGATRGAGRGIAIKLGAAGATVYCNGRSTRAHRYVVEVQDAGKPADATG